MSLSVNGTARSYDTALNAEGRRPERSRFACATP